MFHSLLLVIIGRRMYSAETFSRHFQSIQVYCTVIFLTQIQGLHRQRAPGTDHDTNTPEKIPPAPMPLRGCIHRMISKVTCRASLQVLRIGVISDPRSFWESLTKLYVVHGPRTKVHSSEVLRGNARAAKACVNYAALYLEIRTRMHTLFMPGLPRTYVGGTHIQDS
jgi:hypothetical protein